MGVGGWSGWGLFLMVLEAGSSRLRSQQIGQLVGPLFPAHGQHLLTMSSYGGWGEGALGGLFLGTLILFMT